MADPYVTWQGLGDKLDGIDEKVDAIRNESNVQHAENRERLAKLETLVKWLAPLIAVAAALGPAVPEIARALPLP